MALKTVELHPASRWDCEECGRENFCRMFPYRPTDAELAEVMQEDTGHEWLTAPKFVTCQYCKAKFEAEVGTESGNL
jgi:hypothetical protein